MLKLELGSVEGYCLIRCCHCRRDEIDRKVTELLTLNQLDNESITQVIALDGERFIIDRLLEKLWKVKDH